MSFSDCYRHVSKMSQVHSISKSCLDFFLPPLKDASEIIFIKLPYIKSESLKINCVQQSTDRFNVRKLESNDDHDLGGGGRDFRSLHILIQPLTTNRKIEMPGNSSRDLFKLIPIFKRSGVYKIRWHLCSLFVPCSRRNATQAGEMRWFGAMDVDFNKLVNKIKRYRTSLFFNSVYLDVEMFTLSDEQQNKSKFL